MANVVTKRLVVAGLAALGLSACDSSEKEPLKIEVGGTSQAVTSQFQGVADGFASAMAFLNDSTLVKDSLPRDCTTTYDQNGNPIDNCQPADISLHEPAQESSEWLSQHLFNQEHVDTAKSTDTRIVFCLKPADLCDAAPTTQGGTPTLDQVCVRTLTDVPMCVAISSYAQGEYDGEILVGSTHPADVHIRADRVAAEANLADVHAAATALSTSLGEPLGEEFPKRMAGKIGGELVKLGNNKFSVKLSVQQAVEIDVFDAADPKRTEVRVAAAPNLLSATVDGDQKTVDVQAELKAVDLKIAADLLYGGTEYVCTKPTDPTIPPDCQDVEKHYTGVFMGHLAGLTGGSLFQGAADTLALNDLSLGEGSTTVSFKDGNAAPTQILKVDLNSMLPVRKFNLTISHDATGTTVKVSPSFDLVIAHDLQVLASQFTDIEPWAMQGTTQVKFNGNDPTLFAPENDGSPKVVSGQVELKATGMSGVSDVDVVATAGQCINEVDSTTLPANHHPFAEAAAGLCAP